MTALDRLLRAWDKADRQARVEFLTFLDQWQQARREEVEQAKSAAGEDHAS